MSSKRILSTSRIFFFLLSIQQVTPSEDGYLRYVKDGCFIREEALSCVKYKALKIAKKTIFGDNMYSNETIRASKMISFIPLDEETIRQLAVKEEAEVLASEPRSIFSEWTELTKYFMKLVKDFFKMKGLKIDLPEGARTIEEQGTDEDARGKKKKLALILPLLSLLAAIKTKLMLIPILLAVLLIKKLLLIAALLLPSLLNTLKHCKKHHSYSYFGSNDASDFSSDYGNTYSYGTGGGYSKDWALNRAYQMPKNRPTPAPPMYMTAPGAAS